MVETSGRLLRLLSLFQMRRYWPGLELAQRLEVTGRTLRRDVDRLRNLGYPVHSTAGAGGGYQLGAGATVPPLLLDDDEAVAVAVGLRTAAGGSLMGMEEASMRALAKIEQVMPARLRGRVRALQTSILPMPNCGQGVDGETLSVLAGACRDQTCMQFRYKGNNRVVALRDAEPHRLVHSGRHWYLVAWDAAREDWRTFRLDRIEGAISIGARFGLRQPPDGGFAEYVTRSLSFAPHPFKARVLVHADVEEIADRVPPSIGALEALPDGTCLLQTGARSLEMLAWYLGTLGVDVEVLEPIELIDYIQALGERLTKSVGKLARAAH